MKESFNTNSVVSVIPDQTLQQINKVLVTVIAALCLISVYQVSSAQSFWSHGQSHFASLPSYPNQARSGMAYGVLNITNSAGTQHWQFDVSNQVFGLNSGQCHSVFLNQNIMRWLLTYVTGSGDFNYNVEAYNNSGQLIARGHQPVRLTDDPILRDVSVNCNGQAPNLLPHELLAELELNLLKWQQQNISDYSIVNNSSCGICTRLPGTRVEVRNNQIISQVNVGDGLPSQDSDNLTVQDAFNEVRNYIETANHVSVTYDVTYSFPTYISVDLHADPRFMDDGFSLSFSEFTPLNNGGSTQVTEVTPPLVSAALAELDLNLRKWQQQNITDYSIVSSSSCGMCRGSTAIRVDVRNNQVVSQINAVDGLPNQRSDLSVQGAFDSIRSTILEGERRVQVSYDAFYGYPTSISTSFIDPMIMDGHSTRSFSEFTPYGDLTEATSSRLIQENNGYLPPDVPVTQITQPQVRVISVLPPAVLPTVLTRTIQPPVASCQASNQSVDSIDMMKANGVIWACVRGQKATPCHTVELMAQRSGSQFSIVSRAEASGEICSQVITPFAELVALDTSGLGYGSYPVSLFPLHSQGSVVETRFINR